MNQALLNITLFVLFSHFLNGENKVSLNCETAQNSSRVVVAGGSITEIIYFLNSEEKIVALDVTSNYPKKAKEHYKDTWFQATKEFPNGRWWQWIEGYWAGHPAYGIKKGYHAPTLKVA